MAKSKAAGSPAAFSSGNSLTSSILPRNILPKLTPRLFTFTTQECAISLSSLNKKQFLVLSCGFDLLVLSFYFNL